MESKKSWRLRNDRVNRQSGISADFDDDDDDDNDGDDNDDDDNDDDADHTEVMRSTDGQVALNCAAHHQEDGTAQSDPG